MTSPRRLPAGERRALLMAAATRLFAERGYDGVTLDDVAAGAGVTKPIVYRHFASKKELHLALLATHRDALLATLATGAAQAGSVQERIGLVAAAWLGFVDDHPYASRMLFRDTTGEPDLARFHEEMRAAARGALVAALRADARLRVPESELEPAAEMLRAAMVGLAQWRASQPDLPRATLARAATRLLGEGLAGYA